MRKRLFEEDDMERTQLPVQNGTDVDNAELLFMTTDNGGLIVPDASDQPLTIDLVSCIFNRESRVQYSEELSSVLQKIADHGQKLGINELIANLQSRGFRVRVPKEDSEDWSDSAPDPFEGFKEYYAAPSLST